MKKTCWTVLFVGLCFAFGGLVSQVTSQNAPQLPVYVAVADVAELIKVHPEFKAKTQALQAKMKAEEDALLAVRKQIEDKQLQLGNSGLVVGSDAHTARLEEIESAMLKLDKDFKSKQRALALENSQILFDTFQDIKREIAIYSETRLVAQVVDIRMFTPNPANPQSVVEDMEQKLVWYNPRLDITAVIANQIYQSKGMAFTPEMQQELRTAAKVQQELQTNAQQRATASAAVPVTMQ